LSKPRLGRQSFRKWVDGAKDPGWALMPLTHITTGILAQDIIEAGSIEPKSDRVFDTPVAYFFYGRPAYRIPDVNTIRAEVFCPYCFIFSSSLIQKSSAIHAFDTGALAKRMYQHIFSDQMAVADFSMETDSSRPNKLISKVFCSLLNYFNGDLSVVAAAEELAKPHEFHARAYLQLLKDPTRNELDDRICTIEVILAETVPLAGYLEAIVVPHTLWDHNNQAPWLITLNNNGVATVPYLFVPGRHPEHYHAVMESAVSEFYKRRQIL
jgi:hypothetical protein